MRNKGYVSLLIGFFVAIILFYTINAVVSKLLSDSAQVSDDIAVTYKIIDISEFIKLNAQQALKFSINKTAEQMNINISDIKTDDTLRQLFLGNLTKNFDPSLITHMYISQNIDFDVKVDSISIDTLSSVIYATIKIQVFDIFGQTSNRIASTTATISQNF